MQSKDHVTTDDPGPRGAEHMHFEGEAKRRANAVPSRGLIGAMLVIAILLFFAAGAMACQRLVEFNTHLSRELV